MADSYLDFLSAKIDIARESGFAVSPDAVNPALKPHQRDSTKANNLTLYPHREKDFWLWVSSWALFISKPSDLGYDDAGYDLPEIDVRWHTIPVDNSTAGTDKHGQVKMIRDAAFGLKDAAKEKRKGIGIELTPDYFRDGVAYLREADMQISSPTLLDLIGD